jgi:outer membrane protein TolC
MAIKIVSAVLLLLSSTGCAMKPLNMLRSMDDFRKMRPALDLEKLAQKKTLSLFEVQAAALQNNPTYLAAYQAIKAAKYRYYRSLASYLPSVQGNLNVSQRLSSSYHIKIPPAG